MGELSKKGGGGAWIISRFKRGLAERGGGVFLLEGGRGGRGGDTPIHTISCF